MALWVSRCTDRWRSTYRKSEKTAEALIDRSGSWGDITQWELKVRDSYFLSQPRKECDWLLNCHMTGRRQNKRKKVHSILEKFGMRHRSKRSPCSLMFDEEKFSCSQDDGLKKTHTLTRSMDSLQNALTESHVESQDSQYMRILSKALNSSLWWLQA